MTVTADALDLLAGDPPRYPHIPGDFYRHPETGAPYVNHPTETKADGTPKRVMYGRPSSFGSALDNPFNLVKWKERQLLKGAWSIEPEAFYTVDWDDKSAVDGLAARCHDAAGSHIAADQGTHIHRLCERVDKNEDWTDLLDAGEQLGMSVKLQHHIMGRWIAFRRRMGLTALAVEQTVVNDRWRLAGTLDRLDVADHDILTAYGILPEGCPFIGDIKTGSLTLGNDGQPSYWVKYSTQIAAYVDSVPYDTETDERGEWGDCCPDCDQGMAPPHEKIALIYHYDLARALAGEVVDWQAIPVNVDAGREGGDLCRAAADFAKRRDLFAMPAPSKPVVCTGAYDCPAPEHIHGCFADRPCPHESAVPAPPTVVEQQAADPEPSTASCPVPGSAVMFGEAQRRGQQTTANNVTAIDRSRLRARIAHLVATWPTADAELRRYWPDGVPTLKHDGHSDAQLQLILACVRRVEAEVGAGWHPDDGPPPHVNTDSRASIEYPAAAPDEGEAAPDRLLAELNRRHSELDMFGVALCHQVAAEAHAAGRSISVSAVRSVRRYMIARALVGWAECGRTVDDLWFAASNLATFEQCRDPSATLGGLISQFTIEQADRLYEAAGQ